MDDLTKKEIAIAYQIIDANLNRIREGMRCVEEAIRYDTHKKLNYGTFRSLRHEFALSEQVLRNQFPELIKSRNMLTDRGTDQPADLSRINLKSLLQANVNRVSEGFRVLEEYLKLLPNTSNLVGKITKLRYDWYSLDQQITSIF